MRPNSTVIGYLRLRAKEKCGCGREPNVDHAAANSGLIWGELRSSARAAPTRELQLGAKHACMFAKTVRQESDNIFVLAARLTCATMSFDYMPQFPAGLIRTGDSWMARGSLCRLAKMSC